MLACLVSDITVTGYCIYMDSMTPTYGDSSGSQTLRQDRFVVVQSKSFS